jgi:ABC-type lipopolysaccharide export system ATPase subunit
VLELVDLRRRYGETVALDGLSPQTQEGRLLGFVGPNGAVGPEAQLVAATAHQAGRAYDVTIEVEDQPSAAAARAGVSDESLDAALVGNAIVSLSDQPDELAQLLQASSRDVRVVMPCSCHSARGSTSARCCAWASR